MHIISKNVDKLIYSYVLHCKLHITLMNDLLNTTRDIRDVVDRISDTTCIIRNNGEWYVFHFQDMD
jgi:hypothetical protein